MNPFPDDLELLYKLFEVVKLYTLSAGGDGDGWIISEHYKEYAGQFEAYEKQSSNWFTERYNGDGIVAFGHNQEAVHFASTDYQLPEWAGDIVVRIY